MTFSDKVLKTLLLALGIYGILIFFVFAQHKLYFPYAINLGEPAFLQNIRMLSEGYNPYKDIQDPPFTLVPYGPVYLVLSAASLFLFKTGFVGPRLLCLLATCVVGFLIFKIVQRKTGILWISALSASLFFIQSYIERWSVQVNVDMTGVAFALGAFFFLERFLESKGVRKGDLITGLLLSLTAMFTKSSMAAPFFMLIAYLLIQKNVKLMVPIGIGYLLTYAGIYGILNVTTQGHFYFHTTYEIGKRLIFWEFIPVFWKQAVNDSWLWVGALVGFFIYYTAKKRFTPFYFYYFFATLLTFSVIKQGSDSNYFLEWAALSSIAIGILLNEVIQTVPKFSKIVLLVILAQMSLLIWPNRNLVALGETFEIKKKFFDEISTLVRSSPDPILSEDMGLLIANNKKIVYEPFPMGQMSYSGVWDNKPVLQMLEREEFSLAILFSFAPRLKANRMFTQEFMQTFNAHYTILGGKLVPWSTGKDKVGYFVYRPKGQPKT